MQKDTLSTVSPRKTGEEWKLMNKIEHVFGPEMFNIREELLISALSACSGVYYDFNVTKDVILGTPVQIVDGVEYAIHETIGLPEHCPFTRMIQYWGNRLDLSERKAYFRFFALDHLKKCFEKGDRHIVHTYWTHDILDNPMLAEQHILLYSDVKSGDLLGLTYIKDLKPLDELVQKEKEARLTAEKALEEAQTASQVKTDFLLNMSHDIRTPMNAIVGFADVIAKNSGNEKIVSDSVKKLQASCGVLMELINNVLELSRIESGKTKIVYAPIDLSLLSKEIFDMFDAGMRKKGVAFNVNCNLQDNVVMCDRLRLNQIFINLVGNAEKFTPAGGSVIFSATQNGDEYVFVVGDTGIGMSEEFQKTAFESFEREQTTTQSGVTGSGLGLAIVRKLTLLMGGEMELRSQKNVGTEITVKFRLEKYDGQIQPEDKKAEQLPSFKGKRVLLVEDNELNRELAFDFLLDLDFDVETAENGQIAVEKVVSSQAGYYDLILMDIQMPVLDGYDATKQIRALEDKALASIPIVAMTANAFDEDRAKALACGMNEYVTKPIDATQLIQKISRFL